MQKRYTYLGFGLLLLTLLFSTILAACGSSPTTTTTSSNTVSSTTAPTSIKAVKGSVAPDLTGKDINGQEIKLSSFKGKAVLVNFWTTW